MNQANTTVNSALQMRWMSLNEQLNQDVLGQPGLMLRLLIALLADGHLLVEGAPGLAKTRAIKALAQWIDADFHRIQFTPDLLPGDLTGTDIFHPEHGTFKFQKGPLFHQLLLADEINRAPAKVQSALLEAMAERQVTIGAQTYMLPELFFVMATQNSIEHEGTYPLPEAQLDRFLLYVKIKYPEAAIERDILALARKEAASSDQLVMKTPRIQRISQKDVFAARREMYAVHLSEALEEYLVQLVIATRNPAAYSDELARWIRLGASPRASIALDRCARAHAWLSGRDYVLPEDIQLLAHDVLRHRILLSFEAEAEGLQSDDFIDALLKVVAVP